MERIDAGQPFARDRRLRALAGVARRACSTCSRRSRRRGGGGLIAVFGSGGERDTAKRRGDGPDRRRALPPRRRRPTRIRGARTATRSSTRSCAARRPPAPRRGVDVLGDRGPPRGDRGRVRAGAAGRRRAARGQGPRADDPVRGRRDPLGRGGGRARGARGDGLTGGAERCGAACSRCCSAPSSIALFVVVGLPGDRGGRPDRRASRRPGSSRTTRSSPSPATRRPTCSASTPTRSGSGRRTRRSAASRSARLDLDAARRRGSSTGPPARSTGTLDDVVVAGRRRARRSTLDSITLVGRRRRRSPRRPTIPRRRGRGR